MTAKRFTVDNDGQYWDRKSNKYVTLDHLFYLVEELEKENEQLRKDVARYRGNFREMEDVKCELADENKRLKNEIETYKSGNALLKKTLDKEWK